MSQVRKRDNSADNKPVNPARKTVENQSKSQSNPLGKTEAGLGQSANPLQKGGGDKSKPPSSSKRSAASSQNRRTAFILAGVVVVIIAAIVGIMGYPTYVAPFRRPVIIVDDINIRMDYFLKRAKISGADPISLITELTNDQIVKLGAQKLGISVAPADIDQTMKTIFQGSTGNASNTNVTDAEFNEWYRQQLNESGFTDAEYRDIIAIELYRSRLKSQLETEMPTTAEHAHIYLIHLEKEEEAVAARARWAAGENFTSLAKQLSLDTTTGENGGEIGWFPKGGILTPLIEEAAFTLSTGNVSEPLAVVSDVQQEDGTSAPGVVGFQLVLVSERAERELDTTALQVLKSKVVDTWLASERKNYKISWHGLNNGFDSETYAWINYQVAKSKPPTPTATPPR